MARRIGGSGPRYFREKPGSGPTGSGFLFFFKGKPEPAVNPELSLGVGRHAERLAAHEGAQSRPRLLPSRRQPRTQVAKAPLGDSPEQGDSHQFLRTLPVEAQTQQLGIVPPNAVESLYGRVRQRS
jgi:hypothetical protein